MIVVIILVFSWEVVNRLCVLVRICECFWVNRMKILVFDFERVWGRYGLIKVFINYGEVGSRGEKGCGI